MKYYLIIILMIFIILPSISYSMQKTESHARLVQTSESPAINIGVRAQDGEFGSSYKAVFVVTCIKGPTVQYRGKAEYKIEKRGSGSDWLYVAFPKDFASDALAGTYAWKCLINNKDAASGQFVLSYDGLKIKPQ